MQQGHFQSAEECFLHLLELNGYPEDELKGKFRVDEELKDGQPYPDTL